MHFFFYFPSVKRNLETLNFWPLRAISVQVLPLFPLSLNYYIEGILVVFNLVWLLLPRSKRPYSNNYLTQKVNSAEIYKFCTRLLHLFVMCVPFTFVSITLVFTFVCPLHPGDFLLTYLPTDWVLLQLYLLCWSVSKYLLRKC